MTGEHDVGRVVANAQQAMLAGSTDGTITFVNERFTRETGHPADAIVGRPYWILLHPDDVAEERESFRRLGEGELDAYHCSVRLATEDGDYRPFDVSVIAVRDGEESSGALVMIAASTRGAEDPPPVSLSGDRLIVGDSGRTLVLPASAVTRIEADGSYSVVHAEGQRHLVRVPLRAFEEGLAGSTFCRVHRSSVVNFVHLRQIRHLPRGDAEAVLEGGVTVRVSRSHREEVERRLRAMSGVTS